MDKHFDITLVKCTLYGIAGVDLIYGNNVGAGLLFVVAAFLGVIEEL